MIALVPGTAASGLVVAVTFITENGRAAERNRLMGRAVASTTGQESRTRPTRRTR
jgi:hypothetical protein